MAGGANPQMTAMPGATGPGANPYQQAAGAQTAALGRVGQGMYQTAVPGMQAYANPYETQAGAAGAFGGSRHGIAQAEALKGFSQQAMDQTARLRAQGFNTALGASQADIGRQLGAAGQMAGLGGQSFGYGQAIQGQQAQQGAQQQQMMQSLIDAAKGQYAGYTGAPQQGLNTMLGTTTGVPGQTAGQTSSMTPGLFNYLQAAASF